MDEAGQRNFSKALAVAKQIFNSLTEYIQVTLFPFPFTLTKTVYRYHPAVTAVLTCLYLSNNFFSRGVLLFYATAKSYTFTKYSLPVPMHTLSPFIYSMHQ